MKTKPIRLMLGALLALTITTFTVTAAQPAGTGKWALGARRHIEHSEFTDLPYQDDDYSYGIAYEYHESTAYWQLALDFCPDLDGADMVLTPNINLIIKDNVWRAGIGLMKSYITDDATTGKDDWTDIYWQLLVGINMPLFGQNVDIFANYTYEDWDQLGEFDMNDVEYGVWIKFNL